MVEHIYKCDYCGERVEHQSKFFQRAHTMHKVDYYSSFLSREYNAKFYIVIESGKELCVSCAKKAIIDIGQQFLTDKVRGIE